MLPILIDCDEVLSDFSGEVCRLGREHAVYAMREDITQFDIGAAIGWNRWRDAVDSAIMHRELVYRMPPIEGAIAWLRGIEDEFGADRVYVCTSPWNAEWAGQRSAWLSERGVPITRQIQCKAKQLVAGHLIDDSVANLKGRLGFCIARPWNAGYAGPRGDYAAALAWLRAVA